MTLAVGWLGAALVALALARLIHADAFGPQHWRRSTSLILLGGGVGLGLIASGNWWLCHRRRVGADSAPGPTELVVATRPSTDYDILSTGLMTIDTSRFSTRTVEVIKVADGYYRHELTREFTLPKATDPPGGRRIPLVGRDTRGSATFLLPVIRLSRDVLVDNLEVRTPDGQRMSTLNIAEYYGLIARVVRAYVKVLSDRDELTPEQQASIDVMLESAGFLDPDAPDDRDAPRAARAALGPDPFAWIWSLPLSPERDRDAVKWEPLRARLHQFCKAVSDAYIVFAPVTAAPGDRVVLSFAYTSAHRPREHGLRDRMRYRLGLRPHEHRFTLTEHRWAQSYHLEFWAPFEQYVYATDVHRLRAKADYPGNMVEFFPDGRQGSDYAHVYVRESDRTRYRTRDEMVFEVDCREKPPGMLGIVMVVAFAEAALIWVVGWRHSFFFPDAVLGSSAVEGNNLPALLLALPGVVVGFLGAQFTGEKLRSTSMATMWGMVLCGLIAIGTTAVALAKTSGSAIGEALHADHPIWLGFMVVSLVLAGDLFLRNWIRSRRFSRRINRDCGMANRLI